MADSVQTSNLESRGEIMIASLLRFISIWVRSACPVSRACLCLCKCVIIVPFSCFLHNILMCKIHIGSVLPINGVFNYFDSSFFSKYIACNNLNNKKGFYKVKKSFYGMHHVCHRLRAFLLERNGSVFVSARVCFVGCVSVSFLLRLIIL